MLGGDTPADPNTFNAPQFQPETGQPSPPATETFDPSVFLQEDRDDGLEQLARIFSGEAPAVLQDQQAAPPQQQQQQPVAEPGLDLDSLLATPQIPGLPTAPAPQQTPIDQLTAQVQQLANVVGQQRAPAPQAAPQTQRMPQTDNEWLGYIQQNAPSLDMEDPAQIMAYQNSVMIADMRRQNAELVQVQQRTQYEAHVNAVTAQFQPHVAATLKKYGDVPPAAAIDIAKRAAAYSTAGYAPAQALAQAFAPIKPYLDLVKASGARSSAPKTQQAPAVPQPAATSRRALELVATGGPPNAAGRQISFGDTPKQRIENIERIVGG